MPRRCTVCDHPKRAEIDEALVGATMPYRHIGERYGLNWSCAFRHAATHIPALVAEAHEAELATEASSLLAKVEQLESMARVWHDEAAELLQDAKAEVVGRKGKRDPEQFRARAAAIQVGTRAVRTIGGVLELLGRVSGELKDRQVNVNVLVTSPEWLRLKGKLLDALGPHPEAMEAVRAVLTEGGRSDGD